MLYDYVRATTRQWGLLEKDKEHGEYARPAVFIVGSDRKIVHAWTDERPPAEEILAKVTEITGLPKPPKEAGEKTDEAEEAAAEDDEKPKKMSAEEREKIKAERRAAREAGKPLKKPAPESGAKRDGRTEAQPAGARSEKHEEESEEKE